MAIVYQTGFEGATPEADGWAYSQGYCNYQVPQRANPCIYLDYSTTRKFNGNQSLKMYYDTNAVDVDPWSQAISLRHNGLSNPSFVPGLTNIYTRHYEYVESGFLYSSNNSKLFYFKNVEGRAPSFVLEHNWGSKQRGMAVQGWADTCTGSGTSGSGSVNESCVFHPNMASIDIPTDRWFCFECHIDLGSPGQYNGMVELWIDGTQTLGLYNRRFRFATDTVVQGFNVNGPSTTINWFQIFKQAGFGARYIDDLVIATHRIGCGSLPVDTTPPAVPTGLSIPSTGIPALYTWNANNESDLAGYRVYRKLEACAGGGSTSLLATVPVGTTSYQDSDIPAATTNLGVQVSAYDTTGNESAKCPCVSETLTPPAGSTSVVATLDVDGLGADLTFTGNAIAIRYWTGFQGGTKTEITGLGGVTSYRLSRVWTANDEGFVCTEAMGTDGIWSTVHDADDYVCAQTVVVADVDPPATPTGLIVL